MDLEKKMVLTALEERAGQWNALERNYPEVTNPKSIPMKGKAWKNFSYRRSYRYIYYRNKK